MTTRFHLRPVAAAILIAALTGCATTGPNQNVFYGTGNSFRMNGLLVSELQADTFGPGVSRLTVKSRADGEAMDKLIGFYTSKASEAVAKGDAEAFAVAWHLSKKLASARLEQLASTEIFVNNLAKTKNGMGALPGGARVFLPNTLYDDRAGAQSKKKRASIDDLVIEAADMLAEFTPNWGAAPKVAALGDGIKGILGSVGTTSSSEQRLDATALGSMAVGSAYSVRDSQGNKYIVEKSSDGIILHNPDSAPTKVDLNQLNFMPILDKPDQYRYEAARIVRNINALFEEALKYEASARGALSIGGHHSIAPNQIKLGDKMGFLNADGTLASVDLPAVRKLYTSNRAYKLAVDLTTQEDLAKDNNFISFKYSCSNRSFRVRHGDALEYATYSCRDNKNQITYSRTYVIGNSFVAQNWDSILKDRGYVDDLKSASQWARLIEAATAFTPFFGNLDGAARCAGMDSFSYTFANSSLTSSINADVKKFIAFTPERETPSAIGKVLDCAQGVGAIGTVRKVMSDASDFARLENIYTSPIYKKTTDVMKMFDTDIFGSKKTFDQITAVSNGFSSPTAMFLAKVFYDKSQQVNNISGLADAAYKKYAN